MQHCSIRVMLQALSIGMRTMERTRISVWTRTVATTPDSTFCAAAHLAPCAGVMGPSGTSSTSQSSADQVDHHMLVNHLGPFLLTGLMLPLMTAGSRVVNVSSRAHFACKDLQINDSTISSGSDWW